MIIKLLLAVGAILALYVLAPFIRPVRRVGGAVVLGVAVFVGWLLPDVDLLLGQHRSVFTHSVLAVLILSCLAVRHAACGLSAGIGMHLSADLFPRAWAGFAYIKVPFIGSIGPLSFAWIALNALAAIYIAAYLLKLCWPNSGSRGAACVILLGTAYFYEITMENSVPGMALFVGALAFSLYRARPVIPIERLVPPTEGLAGAPIGGKV